MWWIHPPVVSAIEKKVGLFVGTGGRGEVPITSLDVARVTGCRHVQCYPYVQYLVRVESVGIAASSSSAASLRRLDLCSPIKVLVVLYSWYPGTK